jgi:hypothetical protein
LRHLLGGLLTHAIPCLLEYLAGFLGSLLHLLACLLDRLVDLLAGLFRWPLLSLATALVDNMSAEIRMVMRLLMAASPRLG